MSSPKPTITLEDIRFAQDDQESTQTDEGANPRNPPVNLVRFSTPCFSRRNNESTDLLVQIKDNNQSASEVLQEARDQLCELIKNLARLVDDDGWEGR